MTVELWSDKQEVEEHTLQIGPELGIGGQGRVLRILGRSAPVVFKQYIVPGADHSALKTLVELPASLQPAERERLLRLSAWPLARVMRQGQLSGFVMQEIPGHFFAANSLGTIKARELQYLLYQRKPAWGDIVPEEVGVAARLAVATECAKLINLLHSRSLVLGDVSMNNVLWAPGDPASVFLIDCDGIRRLGSRPVLPQAQTPDWDDPLQPASGPDLDTDRYKLALLVGRVLCAAPYLRPGQELQLVPGVPDRIAVKVRELWTQAARPSGSRPDAWHWMTAVQGREERPVSPPQVRARPSIPLAEMERSPGGTRPQIPMPPRP